MQLAAFVSRSGLADFTPLLKAKGRRACLRFMLRMVGAVDLSLSFLPSNSYVLLTPNTHTLAPNLSVDCSCYIQSITLH